MRGTQRALQAGQSGPKPEGLTTMDNSSEIDVKDLYEKLEKSVIHRYYNDKNKWIEMMKDALSINGSFFSTNRMMLQYISSAYLRKSVKK